VYMWKTQII